MTVTRRPGRRRPSIAGGMLGGLCVLLVLPLSGCGSSIPVPEWVGAFGYEAGDVHPMEIGEFGYPYVSVQVAGTQLTLAFDTGNMVGVSVSSSLFTRIGLESGGSWIPLGSTGAVGATLRVARAVPVSLLGRDLGPTPVYEIDHPDLPGLVGPTALGGGHFTMDYASRRMALSAMGLPERIPGFGKIPLVRSDRHPSLVLVRGSVEGQPVLIELDTGKSRTVINPALSSGLRLERRSRGATITNLRIGDLSFEVPAAKEVDQTGIDTDLPEPIMLGIGSDILSRFIWTVDYDGGALWVPTS